jgi:hypothetical protein
MTHFAAASSPSTRHLVGWNGEVRRFQPSLHLREDELHDLLLKAPEVIADDLMWIGQQVKTGNGRKLDLLGLTRSGALIVIEAKRSANAAEAFAAAIIHHRWAKCLSTQDLIEHYEEFCGGQLVVDFYNAFGDAIALNGSVSLCIVAPDAHRLAPSIVALDASGIGAFGVEFECFDGGGERFFTFEQVHQPRRGHDDSRVQRRNHSGKI